MGIESKQMKVQKRFFRALILLGRRILLYVLILYTCAKQLISYGNQLWAGTDKGKIEILRAVKSLRLTEKKKVATPADWQPGDPCMVPPVVKDEEIPLLFPKGVTVYNVPSGKRYIRMTPQPDMD